MKANSNSLSKICFAFILMLFFCKVPLAAPYELTVYSDEVPKEGESEIEILSSLARINSTSLRLKGNIIQNLIEYNYGLSNQVAIGFELPSSNFHGQSKFQGLKAEIQILPDHDRNSGWYYGVRADFGYEASEYENTGSHALEVNTILGFRSKMWHFVVNPSIEKRLDAENKQSNFIPRAKILYGSNRDTKFGLEFYGSMGPLGAFYPVAQREENLYSVIEKEFSNIRINLGLGKPIHLYEQTSDAWIIKFGLNFDIER
jgi:hypothetical protein